MLFLDIYWTSLLILVPCVTLVLARNIVLRTFGRFSTCTVVATTKKGGCEEEGEDVERRDAEEARKFRWLFLRVYLLVMGSEWLQGPYMYTFLKDEKNYSDRTVALLYMAAYISAAISAPLTGYLADRIGRRTACLAYCAVHSLASLSVLSSALGVILAGRILAGVGTTLLWSVFESWMVAEYNARGGFGGEEGKRRRLLPLSAMYGVMTTYNCTTAILAGLVAHCVVLALGSKTHLFILALILDSTAAVIILRTWTENRGGAGGNNQLQQPHDDSSTKEVESLGDRLLDSLKNVRVWVLSLVSCCFEGTIFLFMYYWPGSMQVAHDHHGNTDSGATPGHQLPFGVIFASFMAIMVLGALLFDILMTRQQHGNTGSDDDSTTTLHQRYLPTGLLTAALLLGGLGFLGAAFFAHHETPLLCAFLLLEAGNGLYVPSMGYQRSQVVSDARRASVYGFMNMPLFVFVALALVTTNGGQVDDHRHIVFVLCAVLLFAAGLGAFIGLRVRSSPEKEYEEVKGTDVDVHSKSDSAERVT
ncbi:uncharacterized protein PG986_004466 [Apiospora aurea]|uniref:Molybdate-anion transporter n=1 Tax=Apiospora aurea TaxID=335848 RepID=A0ABR1QMP0_9PEZI